MLKDRIIVTIFTILGILFFVLVWFFQGWIVKAILDALFSFLFIT
ncbi:MAG: hypothetical protein ACFFB3_20855 [Candidatus Hodarchaeota archaeon]